MPALTSTDATVLITGANGYIGAWVVKTTLERGYTVRAVVRSASKTDVLKGLFPTYAESGKLEFAVVPDLVEEGAFDEAVEGVSAILHLASPLPSPSPDPQATIRPAVNGTLGVLKSAAKLTGTKATVKRIVITASSGSVGMVLPGSTTPVAFAESDWNDGVVAAVEAGATDPFVVYGASKTLAEKAAWDFYKSSSTLPFDITTLNPPLVYGPTLLNPASSQEIGGTLALWYSMVLAPGEKPKEQLGSGNGYAWVDVRDVAEAHVRSLEKEEVGGERVIVAADNAYIWQQWIDIVHGIAEKEGSGFTEGARAKLPKGEKELTAGGPESIVHLARFLNAKSKRLLGIEYRGMDETARDILVDGARRGWA